MYQKTFEVSENPRITIEDCVGNLTVKSGESNLVTIAMPDEEDNLVFDQDGDAIILTIKDNGRVTCPRGSALNILTTHGNLKVRDIAGDIKIGTVNGNADLRGVGALTLDTSHGSLRLNDCASDVTVASVKGSARVQKVDGPVKLGNVEGSLRVEGLMQGLDGGAIGADTRLGPPYSPGHTYQLTVGSDLTITLPDEPNVRVNITARNQVKSLVPDLILELDDKFASGSIGGGEAEITATVGGSATIRSSSVSTSDASEGFNFDFDFDPDTFAFLDDLGPMIESTVSKAMAQMNMHLQDGMKYFDSEEFKIKMEKVSEKAQRAAERVERQAEDVADQARRKAQRAAERARMRAQQAERRWERASGQRSAPKPEPKPTSVDDKREERLRVLRMVEDGKISTEEAAKLLAALS